MSAGFFANLDTLAEGGVTVDRPRGTAHPRYPHAVYPVDYGYLPNTTSGDGDGIDVFRGSARNGIVAVFLTADVVKRDAEIKVVLDCSDDEVAAVAHFLNVTLGIGGLLVPRHAR
jgi:inorganic pyrophosphatase